MAKIGRNQPCPCGSGKKYKKCCINKPQLNSPTVQNRDELDLLMEKGWSLLQKNETANACDVWIELWNSLKNRFKPEFRDIKDAETIKDDVLARIHYHIPVHGENKPPYINSNKELTKEFFILAKEHCKLFEIETYTYQLFEKNFTNIYNSISKEINWVYNLIYN